MTGLVLSVKGNVCIAIDKDGIVHKFTIDKEILPGRSVLIPKQGLRPIVSIVSSAVSLAVAAMLLIFGITGFRGGAAVPPGTPQWDNAYYEDGEIVIEDADIALTETPDEAPGGGLTAYICLIGGGMLAIGSITLFIKAVNKSKLNK